MNRPLRVQVVAPGRESIAVQPGEALSIGRSAEARLRLDAPQVSGRHATIEGLDGRWMLLDQGSRNGTLVNGTMVGAQVPCELRHGDEIVIHPFRLRIDLGGAAVNGTMATMTADAVDTSTWEYSAFGGSSISDFSLDSYSITYR